MSIKVSTNYDYGYTTASSMSSSSSSSKWKSTPKPIWNAQPAPAAPVPESNPNWQNWQHQNNNVPAQPGLGEPQQYYAPVNDYENATPHLAQNPTSSEMTNASSYISYLVDQLNSVKDKLEEAEEKIRVLSDEKKIGDMFERVKKADEQMKAIGNNQAFDTVKEYLISSIDKFLSEKKLEETEKMSSKEIFDRATGYEA